LTPSVFSCARHHPALHSFPTRRSSDLPRLPPFPRGRGGDRPPRRAPLPASRSSGAHADLQPRNPQLLRHPPLRPRPACPLESRQDRKSTRLNSSHVKISYAVFCLKKKT